MGLIKQPPEISVLAPAVTLPGDRLPLTVELSAARELPVNVVDVSLLGLDLYFRRGGKSFPFEVLQDRQRVYDGGKLAAGTTRLPCSFELPADSPPSFHGVNAMVHYQVKVHVDIPWWPDAQAEYEVNVGWPPRPEMPSEARDHDSMIGYFHGATVRVRLAQEVATTGEPLDVALTLSGLPPDPPVAGVRLSLMARESGPLHRPHQVQSDVAYVFHCLEVPVETLVQGYEVPLTLNIPQRVPPSFRSNRWALSWNLRVESMVTWGPAAVFDVPLTLLPPLAPGGPGSSRTVRLKPGRPRRSVPTVVTEDGQLVWQLAASQSGFFFDGQALRGREADAVITITSLLAEGDARLLCRLDFAPLGLDLKIRPARGLEHLGGGLSIGLAPWDERFRVTGRDALQVTSLLRGTEEQGTLLSRLLLKPHRVEMDDDQCRLHWRGTGQNQDRLMEALEHARQLARQLSQARELIPAPAAMAQMVDAWRALATRLRGELEVADMSVQGVLHGHPFLVRTEWSSGEPLRTVLQLSSPPGPEPVHQLTLTAAGEDGDEALALLPGPARDVATDLVADCLELKLVPGWVQAALEAPLTDPAPVQDRLGQMMQLLAALTSPEGPYR